MQKTFGICLLLFLACVSVEGKVTKEVAEVINVARVWAGHPVNFSLLTGPQKQYVAYYDEERRMTVAVRDLDSACWQKVILPESVKWDSHNLIAMSMDDNGDIHLSGNMHCVPLIYFKTSEPGDITTFERMSGMVGERESRVTYPSFRRGPNKEFIFTYRDGSSGNGDEIYNVYDHETETWSRLIDKPLFYGQGKMNAYPRAPHIGPDGYYHISWVWRDRSGCELNHDLSYARSKDLVNWETSAGKPLDLPITIETGEIVDPIPVRQGLMRHNLGFDSQKRVVMTYYRFDEEGNTQAYAARVEDGKWVIRQITDWDYRWYFQGGGSIKTEIRVGGVRSIGGGKLQMTYQHIKYGYKWLTLDEETFEVLAEEDVKRSAADDVVYEPRGDYDELRVMVSGDAGRSPERDTYYVMRWETLGPNRDRPRKGEIPPPDMLQVYKMRYIRVKDTAGKHLDILHKCGCMNLLCPYGADRCGSQLQPEKTGR